jgi:hypothetical protein
VLPNNLIVIRNQGMDHGGHVEYQEGTREPRKYAQQCGDTIQFGITELDCESNSEFRTTMPSN